MVPRGLTRLRSPSGPAKERIQRPADLDRCEVTARRWMLLASNRTASHSPKAPDVLMAYYLPKVPKESLGRSPATAVAAPNAPGCDSAL